MNSTTAPYNTWKTIRPGGQFGVPTTGVAAVQVTLSAVNPTTPGTAYVRPHGSGTMSYGALSFGQGVTGSTSNTTIVALGPDGTFDVEANTTVNMTIDIQGYFTDGKAAAGGFVPSSTPSRIVDTRTGVGLPKSAITQNTTITVDVGGRGGVPADASAVFVNIEVLNNSASTGFLQPYAADRTNPGTALNFAAGVGMHTSLGATIDLSDGVSGQAGQIMIRSGSAPAGSSIDLVVDVVGYYTSPGASASAAVFTPASGQIIAKATPVSIASGATYTAPVAGVDGIPSLDAGLVAVVGNLAVDDTAGNGHGFLTVWADDDDRPGVSSMDYAAPTIRSNLVTSALGTGGGINIYNGGTDTIKVSMTVQGWYVVPDETSTTLTLDEGETHADGEIVPDPVCEAAAAAAGDRIACAAELTVDGTVGAPATREQLDQGADLETSDGLTVAQAAATRTIYTRTWSQTMRGLYYVNWWETHEGRIFYDNAGHVWSTTETYGYKGYHVCGEGGGVGYSIVNKGCTVEVRYDLSRPAISQWDRFQVHVIWKGIPIWKSHKMHSNAYDNGRITFP